MSHYFTTPHLLEIPAVLLCVLNVYYSAKGKLCNFYYGAVMSVLYFIIDYQLRIYADMTAQVVFLAFQIYGYIEWRYGGEGYQEKAISYAPLRPLITSLIVVGILAVLYSYILSHYTNSTCLPLDISTTVLSYMAIWTFTKKWTQTWWLWMIVDTESILLYSIKGLYLTGLLYVGLLGLAVYAVIHWHRASKVQHSAISLVN